PQFTFRHNPSDFYGILIFIQKSVSWVESGDSVCEVALLERGQISHTLLRTNPPTDVFKLVEDRVSAQESPFTLFDVVFTTLSLQFHFNRGASAAGVLNLLNRSQPLRIQLGAFDIPKLAVAAQGGQDGGVHVDSVRTIDIFKGAGDKLQPPTWTSVRDLFPNVDGVVGAVPPICPLPWVDRADVDASRHYGGCGFLLRTLPNATQLEHFAVRK
ncbi:hypothetical protein M427DRAFT_447494, partial [Gonapodya prolifera JEL478]